MKRARGAPAAQQATSRATTEHYLQIAAELESFVRTTPGLLPLAAPADRLRTIEIVVDEVTSSPIPERAWQSWIADVIPR